MFLIFVEKGSHSGPFSFWEHEWMCHEQVGEENGEKEARKWMNQLQYYYP